MPFRLLPEAVRGRQTPKGEQRLRRVQDTSPFEEGSVGKWEKHPTPERKGIRNGNNLPPIQSSIEHARKVAVPLSRYPARIYIESADTTYARVVEMEDTTASSTVAEMRPSSSLGMGTTGSCVGIGIHL